MQNSTFKVAEARAKFSEILAGANAGEEIVITKGREPYARILPPRRDQKRETAPLKHLCLPDDIFDQEDSEQAAIDSGDHSDGLGIWRGRSPSP